MKKLRNGSSALGSDTRHTYKENLKEKMGGQRVEEEGGDPQRSKRNAWDVEKKRSEIKWTSASVVQRKELEEVMREQRQWKRATDLFNPPPPLKMWRLDL